MADESSASAEPGARDEVDVSIVLPTFNEAASLPLLIPRLSETLLAAGLRAEVIVVDDASPDGTARVARQLADEAASAGQHCPLRVIERTDERGLATAVLAGFAAARGTVYVVMDADGSHPVEALPNMVQTILSDRAEIVVGSRHVQGGGSQDWPLFSQLKSRFAATLAIGLTSMTDPTTGLVAVRRSLLEKLSLDPVGWKIVLEIVVKAHPARLAEVPIIFTDRVLGESKQSLSVLGDYVHHLYKLYQFRFPALIEFLKFCLVGVLGVVVDLSVVSALRLGWHLDTRLCQVGGFAAAVTFNYAANRRFSFERAREIPLLYSYVTYVGANLLGLALRMLVIQMLMSMTSWERDHGYGYLLLSALGIVLATMVNFVGVKYFAFAPERIADAADGRTPRPAVEPRPAATLRWSVLALCALLVGAATFGHAIRGTRSHDERVNLVMAHHIQDGLSGLVHPSVSEEPREPWREHSLPALGNTPLYPALLALAERFGANWGLALLSSLTFALGALAVAVAARRVHGASSVASILLFSTAPWLLNAFSLLEFEPLVATLGVLGFAAIVHCERRRFGLGLAALGGTCLGLAFATKMWLALPAFSASFMWLLVRHYQFRDLERARIRHAALAALTCAGLCGALHLWFVALTAPEDLTLWIERVYLAIFTGESVTGSKLSEGPDRARSAWSYAGFLLRDHGALLVLTAYGLPAFTRRATAQGTAFLFAAAAALLSLVPLSVPAFKEPLYLTPVLPFMYALAGLCLAAAHEAPQRHQRIQQGSARASIAMAGLIVVGLAGFALLRPELRTWSTSIRAASVLVWALPAVFYLAHKRAFSALIAATFASLALGCAELFLSLLEGRL